MARKCLKITKFIVGGEPAAVQHSFNSIAEFHGIVMMVKVIAIVASDIHNQSAT